MLLLVREYLWKIIGLNMYIFLLLLWKLFSVLHLILLPSPLILLHLHGENAKAATQPATYYSTQNTRHTHSTIISVWDLLSQPIHFVHDHACPVTVVSKLKVIESSNMTKCTPTHTHTWWGWGKNVSGLWYLRNRCLQATTGTKEKNQI